MFSDKGTIFCIDSSSMRVVGTFFSVAMTTPFVAMRNSCTARPTGNADRHFPLIHGI